MGKLTSSGVPVHLIRVDRVNRLIVDRFSGNQAAFARAIKRSPAVVWQYLSGHRTMGEKLARNIESALRIPQGYLDDDADSNYESPSLGMIESLKVPLMSWAQVGDTLENDNVASDDIEGRLFCPASHSGSAYALHVRGTSMVATQGMSYPDGCTIFVDPEQCDAVKPGDRVIANVRGHPAVVFMQLVEDLGKARLMPLNSQYSSVADGFTILGKVIGKWED